MQVAENARVEAFPLSESSLCTENSTVNQKVKKQFSDHKDDEEELRLNFKRVPIPSDCSAVAEFFLLSQNGLRSELLTILLASSALREKGENCSDQQFNGFFKWFVEFGEFLHFYLELEEDVIAPFLSRLDKGSGGLQTEVSQHTSVSLQLNTIVNLRHQVGKNRNVQLTQSLFKWVLNLSEYVLTDCAASCALFTPLFKQLSAANAAELARRVDERIRGVKHYEILALMLRSADKQCRKNFLQANLRKAELIKYRMVKTSLLRKRANTLGMAFGNNAMDESDDEDASAPVVPKLNFKKVPFPSNCTTAMESFVLLQNGIRSELLGIFLAATALFEKKNDAKDVEFTGFFTWFSDFEEWLQFYLELEDEVVVPFLSREDSGTPRNVKSPPAGRRELIVTPRHGSASTPRHGSNSLLNTPRYGTQDSLCSLRYGSVSGSEHSFSVSDQTSISVLLNKIDGLKESVGKNRSAKLAEMLFKHVVSLCDAVLSDFAASFVWLGPFFGELSEGKSAELAALLDEKIRCPKHLELVAMMLRTVDQKHSRFYISRKLKASEAIKYKVVKMSVERKRANTIELAFAESTLEESADAVSFKHYTRK